MSVFRPIFVLPLMLVGLWTSVASAEQIGKPAVVVELYTSQGCSSCPPADELLTRLSTHDEIIGLALHVDYWDYLGWKDDFAKAQYTKRQRAYARVAGSRMIYTPQMVIGGRDHVIGTRPVEVAMVLEKHQDQAARLDVTAIRTKDEVSISAEPPVAPRSEIVVQIVRFLPSATVQIERGENRGREITYTNIVTDWQAVTRWNAVEPLAVSVPIEGDDPVVVILQEPGPGEILAAVHFD